MTKPVPRDILLNSFNRNDRYDICYYSALMVEEVLWLENPLSPRTSKDFRSFSIALENLAKCLVYIFGNIKGLEEAVFLLQNFIKQPLGNKTGVARIFVESLLFYLFPEVTEFPLSYTKGMDLFLNYLVTTDPLDDEDENENEDDDEDEPVRLDD